MKKLTPIKAIRAKCLECSCGQISEVRYCLIPSCPLYPYRMGHRPKTEDSAESEKSADADGFYNQKILGEEELAGDI